MVGFLLVIPVDVIIQTVAIIELERTEVTFEWVTRILVNHELFLFLELQLTLRTPE